MQSRRELITRFGTLKGRFMSEEQFASQIYKLIALAREADLSKDLKWSSCLRMPWRGLRKGLPGEG